MSVFFETTWFLWWLAAAVIVARWSWHWIADDQVHAYEPRTHWRHLYRQALGERDAAKLDIRIQEAEGAILVERASQVFTRDGTKRRVLQEAMNNLHHLRQTHSENAAKNPSQDRKRSSSAHVRQNAMEAE